MKAPTLLFMSVICFSDICFAQDNPECVGKTLPFFTTFDGFYIERCKESEFAKYEFWFDGSSRKVEKQGKYREVWFKKKANSPRQVSGLQIIQNHVNAIQSVKGEVLKGSDNGIYKTTFNGNEVWIHLNVYSGMENVDNFAMFSVEIQPLKQEVTAIGIKGSIDSQGKVALYGILFETGKSDIKLESEKELKEIAGYLQSNSGVSIYIVGHTDNVGDIQSNLKLSKSRGETVKQFLMTKYKIEANRLTGDGVGPLCPVASNDNEPGRKMNRRVEIVKK